ncbi:hypothetical protein GGR51DRAFT_555626 [Nemania sp. FL0031]|nr:hypothetical protein GGR51DRAFT_555626 [Nemania sp. FL0031]
MDDTMDDTPALPPMLVNMLVKFIHIDCWGPLHSRCRPQLVAVTVDGTNFAQLQHSLEDAIHSRSQESHIGDMEAAEALRYNLFYAIEWAGHEKVQSADLANMHDVDLRNQFRLIRDRGSVDVLVVRYRYCDQRSQIGLRLHPRQEALTVAGLNMVLDQAAQGYQGYRDVQIGEQQESTHVRGPADSSRLHRGMQRARDEASMEDDMVEGNNGNTHHNRHPSPRTQTKLHVLPDAPLVTPLRSPSPAILVVYDGKREVLAEIALKSPSKIKASQDHSPSEPVGQAIRRMNNINGMLRGPARCVDEDAPAVFHELNGVDDAKEKPKHRKNLAGNKPVFPRLRPNFVANHRQASTGSSSSIAINNSKDMLARVGSRKHEAMNGRVGSDSGTASGSEHAGAPVGSKKASLVNGIVPHI